MSERVLACIYAAIDEANEDRDDLPPLEKSADTRISGNEHSLDSLQLMNFLVAVEEGLERDLGVHVVLTDERLFSRESSPIESVRALAAYIDELLLAEQQR